MKWIAILLLVIPGLVIAGVSSNFHLCSAYVQKAAVGAQTENGWPVHVKLTKVGAASFERFTEANIGRIGRLVVVDREFLRATILEPVPSGGLQGTFGSEEIATAWQQTLVGRLPATPCGTGD